MPYYTNIPEEQNRATRRQKIHQPVGFRAPKDFMPSQKVMTTQRKRKGKKR